MEEKRIPAAVKVLTACTYFLAGIFILACVVLHLSPIQEGMSSAMFGTVGTLTFIGGIIAAVILIADTAILGSLHILKKFPSTLTLGTMVYNDIALIAAVFILYTFDNRGTDFPYPIVYVIPGITFLLSLICILDDCKKNAALPEEESELEEEIEIFVEEEAEVPVFDPDFVGADDNLVEESFEEIEEEGLSEKELRKLQKQQEKEERKQAKLLAKQQKEAERQAAREAKAAEREAKLAAKEAAEESVITEEPKVTLPAQEVVNAPTHTPVEAKAPIQEQPKPTFQNTNVEFKSISFDDFGEYMEEDD